MNKKLASLLPLILLIPSVTFAVCPVCVVAVVGTVGILEKFGVDDVLTGIWIGGLLMSLTIWTVEWLNGKNIKFFGKPILVMIAYYWLSIYGLQQASKIAYKCTLWGQPKFFIGLIFGTVALLIGYACEKYLRLKNNQKAYFKLQKAILPVGALIVMTLIFLLVLKYCPN
jgi:hypothetical protein